MATRWLGLGLVVALFGCERRTERIDDSALKRIDEKLDRVLAQVEQVEDKVEEVRAIRNAAPAAGQAAPRPAPGGPDLAATYSVDITGDPFRGPKFAKVTIVEASEFA